MTFYIHQTWNVCVSNVEYIYEYVHVSPSYEIFNLNILWETNADIIEYGRL